VQDRRFIAIVAHHADLWRREGAATVLRAQGAAVRTLPLWGDPDGLFGDEEAAPRALVVEALDRPDLAAGVLRGLRREPRLERVGALLAVTAPQVARLEPSSGFDDIVLFPYVPDELVARISWVERRHEEARPREPMTVGRIVIDPEARQVIRDGKHVPLSALRFNVLAYLARHRGRLVSREELLQRVWGHDYPDGIRNVDICVCHLRTELGADLPIVTVRGVGYRLETGGSDDGDWGARSPIVSGSAAVALAGRTPRAPLAGKARPAPLPLPVERFVKVTEVWVPSKDRLLLERGQGLYGSYRDFEQISARMRFGHGEGLPGRAWAERQPIVLTELGDPAFKRSEAARAAGLTCGVALPIFAGEVLTAVLLLFCGEGGEHAGAIELWGNDPVSGDDLGLIDGYYGTARAFEEHSRSLRFRCGSGLPGRVWKTKMPVIMEGLGRSRLFGRRESALAAGIETGLGIPCSEGRGQACVMTFLSGAGTPIARRIEVWRPKRDGSALVFSCGHCDTEADLAAAYASVRVAPGNGPVGRAWLTGVPSITNDFASLHTAAPARSTDLASVVAVPIMERGTLKCVVAWYS
jgi:DNA-binding response OmpR family regulator